MTDGKRLRALERFTDQLKKKYYVSSTIFDFRSFLRDERRVAEFSSKLSWHGRKALVYAMGTWNESRPSYERQLLRVELCKLIPKLNAHELAMASLIMDRGPKAVELLRHWKVKPWSRS